MLEKPDVPNAKIIACLRHEYRLQIADLSFLPLGADQSAAVYRAVASDRRSYFVKLRQGPFNEISVVLPRFLGDQGIGHLIAPLPAVTGQLWTTLDSFTVIVYPFVDGRNAYELPLSDDNWRGLGTVLRCIHATALPPVLARRIPQETYPPLWRKMARSFLARAADEVYEDPIAGELAAFLVAERRTIADLVERAGRLAVALQEQSPEFVLCHSDLHAGNILIGADGDFYIVDWDEPILAPKERDLMYAGGGLMGGGRAPREEEKLFYQGYGPARINARALAYYRYERIIQDIAVYCAQIFGMRGGSKDRGQALHYLMSNFLPNNTIEIAYKADTTLQGA